MFNLIVNSLLFASLLMLIIFLIQLKTKQSGLVDVAWSFATACIGVYFCLTYVEGSVLRNYLVAMMIFLWGVRLGLHLIERLGYDGEDGRYQYMKQRLGSKTQPVMFIFFQIQAVWAVLFALPVLVAVSNPASQLSILDYLGIVVWVVAISGEAISDHQLKQFKRKEKNKGKVCQSGFWRYSRHPNYFFEWLHWWAYVLIGYGSELWWLAWLIMVIMLIFLLKVTGIPHTESQSIRSRGQAYRDYQKSTSIFFPLPPKQVRGG